MPNDTVQAAATGLPKTNRATPAAAPPAPRNCRAFALGAEIGRLSAAITGLRDPDLVRATGGVMRDEVARLERREEALLQALTYAVAKSLSGALAQVIVSFGQVTNIIETAELDWDEVNQTLAGVQRCLFSIADVLVAHGAVPAEHLGGDRIMPQSLNLLRINEGLAELYSQDFPLSGPGEVA